MTASSVSATAKQLRRVLRNNQGHWVGDGFPVRTLFAYPEIGGEISPFLMLDYAGPRDFPPTDERLGVGEHPHRGFETVTVVYDGEVEHRDSSGGGGKIGPGDVQWMTAGAGVVHEEFHGREFARCGGRFEMIQLWVNLPAEHKMTRPRYQGIVSDDIPEVSLPEGAGTLRIIAGAYGGAEGPAATFSPINMWDARLTGGHSTSLTVPEGYTTLVVVLGGALQAGDTQSVVGPAEAGLFERGGTRLDLECLEDTKALILCGEPIDEPIAGMGPFVMNTREQLMQAMDDYRNGRMGQL
jgi:redox-sensitive bicupin YhaK (pirin superfamily)